MLRPDGGGGRQERIRGELSGSRGDRGWKIPNGNEAEAIRVHGDCKANAWRERG